MKDYERGYTREVKGVNRSQTHIFKLCEAKPEGKLSGKCVRLMEKLRGTLYSWQAYIAPKE
jgi:hypothetical protein